MSKIEATGRYTVGRYGVPFVNTGHVYWPIYDPQGNLLVTVMGMAIGVGPQHDEQMVASRHPADVLVELLNETILP